MDHRPALTIASLCRWVPPVKAVTLADEVHELFISHDEFEAVAVVESDVPKGIIERRTFIGHISRRYWKDLFGRRSCMAFLSDDALIVDAEESIAEVTFRVLLAKSAIAPTSFIVTRDGRYIGLAQFGDLLQRFAQEQQQALAALTLAQDRLVQAEKLSALGNLVAGLAHELNTPLGVSVTAVSILRDRMREVLVGMDSTDETEELNATVSETLDILEKNLHRAVDLTRRFRNLARTGDESVTIEPLDAHAVVNDIALSLRPMLERQHCHITLAEGGPTQLLSSPAALAQVLVILISNAATHAYGPAGGEIALSWRMHQDQLEVVVADRGHGIDVSQHQRIFEPFYTTARARGGTGLGLHIAHRVATQSLRGTLLVESAVGAGARFILTIPDLGAAP
jgi:signal transduction histidine kinase